MLRSFHGIGRHRRRGHGRRAGALGAGLFAAGLIAVTPATVRAEGYDLKRVEPLTLTLEFGGAFVLFAGVYAFLPTPTSCRWCNPPGFDEELAVPAPLSERRAAAAMSHVVSTAIVPTFALAATIVPPFTTGEADAHAFENLVIVSESIVLTQVLTMFAKKVVARRRPAFYYGRSGATEYSAVPSQEHVSFFSGDTSAPFAAAASAATLGFLRGYPSAPYVAFAGGALSMGAAVLRLRADVHWASDVLTGALVGTAVGVAVPLLLHPRATPASANERRMLLPQVASDSAKLELFGTF